MNSPFSRIEEKNKSTLICRGESYIIFFSIFGSKKGTRFELFGIFSYNLLSNFGIFIENLFIIEEMDNSALVKFVVKKIQDSIIQ